ncbi:MAG: GNAT family N-acetyltransferase [Actinomycetes bacterium]
MTIDVSRVEAEVVRPLRHSVLRAGSDPAESVYPADDLADTVHLAAVDSDAVVGTATTFPEPYEGRPAWRLRGMAVKDGYRGRGIGTALLTEVLAHVRGSGFDLLWCNARKPALTFYEDHGFVLVGEEFLAGGGVPHFLAVCHL